MNLEGRFEQLPGEIQTFIKRKYAAMGRRRPRKLDKVHINANKMAESEEARLGAMPIVLQSQQYQAEKTTSLILDAYGKPYIL